ncbi:zinc finger CCHC domain-containing protein 8-like [Ptychodera flava]|uniref:zinc finger CCHC domain-containing protein 8-like n=1 Tax=Ptychodera flava TaxID=63121 RepID=UPI00396A0812
MSSKMADSTQSDFFGDNSLFEEFGNGHQSSSEESDGGEDQLKSERKEYEEEICRLRQENLQLKQKLRLLIKNSNMAIKNANRDGPVAQIIFMNNDLIKKHHQELEDLMIRLSSQDQELSQDEIKSEKMQAHPQNSAVVLEKDQKSTQSSVVKTRQAFTAISNVQYYNGFCIDQLGRPLIDFNPQLTGWEVPVYQQVFMESLPLEDDGSKPKKKTKAKATCFNCGSEDHSLRECNKPRDLVRISQNRQLFMEQFGTSPRSNRYHKDGEELAKKFPNVKPGFVSDALREALGIGKHQLPPYIYHMRLHGYPPGYLKDAEIESSGLTMYNHEGKATTDTGDELETGEISDQEKRTLYDPHKIIEFPGFNVPLTPGLVDESARLNMPPMRQHQSKEVLQLYFSPASNEARKRGRTDEDKEKHRPWKKQKLNARFEPEMEIESDGSEDSAGLMFKPPLPPDTPASTPPPLPSDTPPSTPGRQTPNRASAQQLTESDNEKVFSINSASNSGQNSRCTTPELAELEEKQKMLLAALEDAGDSTVDAESVTADESQGTGEDDGISVEEDEATTLGALSVTSDGEYSVSEAEIDERKTDDNLPERTDSEEILQDPSEATAERSENISNGRANDQSTLKLNSMDTTSEIQEEGKNGGQESSQSVSSTPTRKVDSASRKSLKGIPDAKNFALGISPYKPHENVKPASGVYLKLRGIMKKMQKEK